MDKKIGIPLLIVALVIVIGAIAFMQKEEPTQVANTNTPAITEPTVAVDQDNEPAMPEATPIADGTYTVVPAESTATWTGKKTLIAEWVDTGTIQMKEGSFVVDNNTITSGQVVFDMSSISAATTGSGSGQDKLAKHLKSADFFDVEQYPTATFAFTSATPVEGQTNTYLVRGDLTMKGITKPIEFPAVTVMEGESLVTTADITVDRTMWDVRFGSDNFFDNLGNNVIDDEFVLSINVVSKK